MRNNLTHLLLYILLPVFTAAQQKQYKFIFQFDDTSPLAFSKIFIDGNELMTDKQGIINTVFTADKRQIKVTTANKSKYIIQSGTEVLLPLDNSLFIQIKVSYPVKQIIHKDLLPVVINKIDKSSKLLEKINNNTKLAQQKALLELENDNRLNKGRQEFYPIISVELNNYLNEVRNFNDAFLALSNQINNKAAYTQLQNSILKYNNTFDILNQNKDKNQQAISNYWKSTETGIKYAIMIDYIIEELHRPYILEINHKFISRINDYNLVSNRKERKMLSSSISSDMKSYSEELSRRLISVGERIVKMNIDLQQ